MIGGLPNEKTALNAHVTGNIQMEGYSIEKLIYESLLESTLRRWCTRPMTVRRNIPRCLCRRARGKRKDSLSSAKSKARQPGIRGDCVGPGRARERSQFWDAKTGKSRYNLVCGEHAVLGNLAYLAGTNLARWEIWDGIRAVDYLLTRPDVDGDRIGITGPAEVELKLH